MNDDIGPMTLAAFMIFDGAPAGGGESERREEALAAMVAWAGAPLTVGTIIGGWGLDEEHDTVRKALDDFLSTEDGRDSLMPLILGAVRRHHALADWGQPD